MRTGAQHNAVLWGCSSPSAGVHLTSNNPKNSGILDGFAVVQVSAISQLYRSDASMRTPASLDALASMLTAMGDPRVVLIKLADRLHNMRTLSALSLEARKRVAQETSAVFVPLANRLGVWSFKAELEDLCLQHTEPEKFAALQVRFLGVLWVGLTRVFGGFDLNNLGKI